MRPNFEEMTSAELRAYALAHRDDVEPLRVLYSRRSPDSEATWYGPMCTPEGVPIEENIRIAEEAIRKRTKIDRVNDQLTPQTMTTVTQEEINQFREQLAGYPEAIAALDLIEQRNGNLETAAKILAIRAGYEPSRKLDLLDELSEKCRKVICQEEFKEDLAAGVIVAVIEPLATGAGIPPGLASAIAIYAFKTGVKKFCQPTDSES
jgi:hypothetical protein